MYLHGNRMEAHLLAVVVPAPAYLHSVRSRLDEPACTATMERELLVALRRTAAANGITTPYMVPAAVVVELQPWSVAAGTLSAIGKLCRGALDAKYRAAFDRAFAAVNEAGGVVCVDDVVPVDREGGAGAGVPATAVGTGVAEPAEVPPLLAALSRLADKPTIPQVATRVNHTHDDVQPTTAVHAPTHTHKTPSSTLF